VRILYISTGGPTQDYLRDCLFRGLRELLGPDVVDVGKLDSMYLGADRSQMYGRGMTLYAELPDLPIDREDIPRKLRSRYFDLVIYGSIHRCQDMLHEVASMYDPRRIIFIDGEDHCGHLSGLPGVTFKRELMNPQPGVFPIQFAIPASKILPAPPAKSRLMAPCDPINPKTYIYKDESSYYRQYAESYYGATMKKAGWCCLRHYEILANWCIPYFRVFDQCPPTIMVNLPRRELRLIQEVIDYWEISGWKSTKISIDLYESLIEKIMAITRNHLTTEALAKYVFDTVGVRCS
jgi:hypothetical protein